MSDFAGVVAALALATAAAQLRAPWALALLCLLILSECPALIAFPALGIALIVWARIRSRASRERQRLERDLPPFGDALAGGLQAGQSLEVAFREALASRRGPFRQFGDRVLSDMELGRPIEDALTSASEPLQSRALGQFTQGVTLARRSGGDLTQLIHSLASDLREDAAAADRLRALGAQGTLQAWVLGLMPVALLGLMAVLEPERLDRFLHDPRGSILLGAMALLQGLGTLWVRHLTRFSPGT